MIIEHIQGLRGIAIIFVILFHFYPNIFKGGFLGVDIFFCISGYVISISLRRRLYKSHYFLNFYSDRIRRLTPPSYSVILSIIYTCNNKNKFTTKLVLYECLYSTISLSNLYYIKRKLDYFSASEENSDMLIHFWSLSVENQFYFFYPLLFLFINEKKELYIIISFFCLCYSIYITQLNSVIAYLYTIPRICEFLIGGLCSYINYKNGKKLNIYIIDILIIILLFYFPHNIAYPSYYILIPCIYIYIYFNMVKNDCYLLTNSFFFKILGKISYSIYLVHYPICVSSNGNSFYKFNKILILSILLYEIFEKPFINKSHSNILVLFIYLISLIIILHCIISKIQSINKILNKSFIHFINYNNKYINSCIFKNNNINYVADKEYVLLLGDSRLQHLIPSLYLIFKEKKYVILSLLFWTDSIKYRNYIYIINKIKYINTPAYILMSFKLHWVDTDIRYVNYSFMNYHFYKFLKYLSVFNSSIYIFLDTLTKQHNCYFDKTNCTCRVNYDCFLISYPTFNITNIKYINLNKYICNYNISECNDYYKEIPVYIDYSHYNVIYTLSIKELIKDELNIKMSVNKNDSKYFECDYRVYFNEINKKKLLFNKSNVA